MEVKEPHSFPGVKTQEDKDVCHSLVHRAQRSRQKQRPYHRHHVNI